MWRWVEILKTLFEVRVSWIREAFKLRGEAEKEIMNLDTSVCVCVKKKQILRSIRRVTER